MPPKLHFTILAPSPTTIEYKVCNASPPLTFQSLCLQYLFLLLRALFGASILIALALRLWGARNSWGEIGEVLQGWVDGVEILWFGGFVLVGGYLVTRRWYCGELGVLIYWFAAVFVYYMALWHVWMSLLLSISFLWLFGQWGFRSSSTLDGSKLLRIHFQHSIYAISYTCLKDNPPPNTPSRRIPPRPPHPRHPNHHPFILLPPAGNHPLHPHVSDPRYLHPWSLPWFWSQILSLCGCGGRRGGGCCLSGKSYSDILFFYSIMVCDFGWLWHSEVLNVLPTSSI